MAAGCGIRATWIADAALRLRIENALESIAGQSWRATGASGQLNGSDRNNTGFPMEFGDLFSFDKKIAPAIIKPIYWIGLILIVFLGVVLLLRLASARCSRISWLRPLDDGRCRS